jgi:UDP-2,3-diacylglucosamine pyrophosphatase LpxH
MQITKYRSIFISDIHLGSRGCKADLLCSFLKHNSCETLYLVGDIVDGWRLQRNWYWPQEHNNVLRRLLTAAKRGTKIKYIAGNHDEAIRPWLKHIPNIGNVSFSNKEEYLALNGSKYLVVHGDMFDTLMAATQGKFLMHIGDRLYDLIIRLNDWYSWLRAKLGMKYWSMSGWLKKHTKQAVGYVLNFEGLISDYCRTKGYDGIICGHIHTPVIKYINGIRYMNDGDWVESCSALVENYDGTWEIIYWNRLLIDVQNTNNN